MTALDQLDIPDTIGDLANAVPCVGSWGPCDHTAIAAMRVARLCCSQVQTLFLCDVDLRKITDWLGKPGRMPPIRCIPCGALWENHCPADVVQIISMTPLRGGD